MENRKLSRVGHAVFVLTILVYIVGSMIIWSADIPETVLGFLIIPLIFTLIVSASDIFKKPISYLSWAAFIFSTILIILISYQALLF